MEAPAILSQLVVFSCNGKEKILDLPNQVNKHIAVSVNIEGDIFITPIDDKEFYRESYA